MKRFHFSLLILALCAVQNFAAPLGSGFTYQGKLHDNGVPANGNYDMIFNLYDAPTDGNVIGSFSIFGAVPVTDGLFTVELNAHHEFGIGAFNGQARWLHIGVRTNSNNAMNPWIYLDPRQPLDCAPQAMFAQNASNAMTASFASTVADGAISSSKLAPGTLAWANISGVPSDFTDGVDNNTTYSAGAGLSLSWLNQFSVNFGGSGAAQTAARSDHDHFGASWDGSNSYGKGLSVTNSSTSSAAGLYGQQGTGSGFPYIFGNTAGVWGESSQGSGVWGASGYATGAGVAGVATATNTANAGVAGTSWSTSGIGVRGLAIATTGPALGVRGETKSSGGYGVAGYASSLAGAATGVYGESSAINGAGLVGHSTFVSGNGANYGVIGQSDSLWGYGVYGHAAASSGINYGVVGEAHSTAGYGVVARNNNGVALKVEGTGIIQSDADSWFWVPGSAANLDWSDGVGTFYGTLVMGDNSIGGGSAEFPLTLPGVLFGQSTTIKSIEVIYQCNDGAKGYISGTELRESDSPMVYSYTDTIAHRSNTKSSYTAPVNYAFNVGSTGFPTFVIRARFTANEFIWISGLKVRLSHK